jgi:predicted secreted hydrolase
MVYRLRRSDGRADAYSSGALVAPDGRVERLEAGDIRLSPGRTWRSEASGARYPIEWTVELPGRQMVLTVSAAVPDQELRTERSTAITYWEGSVTAQGRYQGRRVAGRGYLEMTGYAAGSALSDALR